MESHGINNSNESIEKNSKIELSQNIKNGSDLFNRNCYDYLKQIAIGVVAAKELAPLLNNLLVQNLLQKILSGYLDKKNLEINKLIKPYNPAVNYSELYKIFQESLEHLAGDILSYRNKLIKERDGINIFHDDIPNKKVIQEAKGSVVTDDYHPEHRNLRINNTKEKKLESLNNAISSIDEFIISIYANKNQVLERSAVFAEESLAGMNPLGGKKAEKAILKASKAKSKTSSSTFNPSKRESLASKTSDMFSPNYQPQTTTSIPSIRTYGFHGDKNNIFWNEFRFGTQGEYIQNHAQVNPLFKAFLQIQLEHYQKKQRLITHIYFNNLGFDRDDAIEGPREKNLTFKLHDLEDDYINVAVITLPADKGFMDHGLLDINKNRPMKRDSAYSTIFTIATNGSKKDTMSGVRDFYISNKVKKLLYGSAGDFADNFSYNKFEEAKVIENLINASFQKLGLNNSDDLTSAQFQAVYFHFIKYELTNFIIEKLQPLSINFSCKDAIDRGGVSSLYFNLIKSIEIGKPMTKAEFITALHGASTMVKGRGMNTHVDIVWNAIDNYMKANPNHPNIPTWLKDLKTSHDIIYPIIDSLNYENINTTGVVPENYDTYTQIYASKPSGYDLTVIKGQIAREFVDTMYELSINPNDSPIDTLIEKIMVAIDEALKKSEIARSYIDKNTPIHKSGTLEDQLIAIQKKLVEKYPHISISSYQPTRSLSSSLSSSSERQKDTIQSGLSTHGLYSNPIKGNHIIENHNILEIVLTNFEYKPHILADSQMSEKRKNQLFTSDKSMKNKATDGELGYLKKELSMDFIKEIKKLKNMNIRPSELIDTLFKKIDAYRKRSENLRTYGFDNMARKSGDLEVNFDKVYDALKNIEANYKEEHKEKSTDYSNRHI